MSSRYIFGSILILLGFGFFLDVASVWDFGDIFWDWWPIIFVFVGVSHIVSTKKSMMGGIVFSVLGILLLSSTLDFVSNFWSLMWPVVLILLGVWILMKRNFKNKVRKNISKENEYLVVFGGLSQKINNDDFRQAEVTCIFGGAEIDLREAMIVQDKAEIELTAVFGGIELFVPDEWEIRTSGTPIMGALENKTAQVFAPGEVAPILVINYLAIFGGIDVKNGKYSRRRNYR
jgi:predicted membrane protein